MLELPMKDLLRVDEAAAYFSVTERTIRLWAENGHLEVVKIVGSVRITRESALNCRFGIKKEAEMVSNQEIAEAPGLDSPIENIGEDNAKKVDGIIPAKRGRPPAVQCQTRQPGVVVK